MGEFRLADEKGNVAKVTVLDNMDIVEAESILVSTGINDGDNFAVECERFVYRGVYFYSYEDSYCVDWSNQNACFDSIEDMKEFIESVIF